MKFEDVFPHGAGVVSAVSQQRDFDRSTKENSVQQLDKDSGKPIWIVDVMDFDPEARERTVRVKIIADVQPVPPEQLQGTPVRPVILENLTVMPYQKETGNGRSRIAYSLKATGMSSPKGARHAGGDQGKAA
ncbi:hypothetical protein [Naumannella halotolerans]|uniref:hypothetical protein n=1 Tax=Naumannella halotolerans TaxID=993414 RepID=UPI001FBB5494|nr:hypothetical protein [Naumannella halotolerans]